MHIASIIRTFNALPQDHFRRLLGASQKADISIVRDQFVDYLGTFEKKDPAIFTDWFEAWIAYRDRQGSQTEVSESLA